VLELTGARDARELDARLHAERLGPRATADAASLPVGAFVLHEGEPHVVAPDGLRAWSPGGYGAPVAATGAHEVVTPPTLVGLLATGWRGAVPLLHPSAHG
jgi:hypothetical protein